MKEPAKPKVYQGEESKVAIIQYAGEYLVSGYGETAQVVEETPGNVSTLTSGRAMVIPSTVPDAILFKVLELRGADSPGDDAALLEVAKLKKELAEAKRQLTTAKGRLKVAEAKVVKAEAKAPTEKDGGDK